MPPKKKVIEPVKPKAEKIKKEEKVSKDEEEEEVKQDEKPKAAAGGRGKKKIIDYDASQTTLTSTFNIETKPIGGDGKFSDSKITISSFNVNGLRAILGKKDLIDYITKSQPDAICLNETKIDKESFQTANIQNNFPKEYNCYFNFCKPPRSGYSGVNSYIL
jgi:hypothetical protein